MAVVEGQTSTVTFRNTKPGKITIVKEANPEDDMPFDFTSTQLGSFTLQDPSDNSKTFSDLSAGEYKIAEAMPLPANWELDSISCVTNDTVNPAPVVSKPEVTIDLQLGEEVTCTFTNKEEPTAIDLASFTIQANDGRAMVMWETGTEIDNAGFNLYRAASEAGPWVKVNQSLIAAEGDPVSGASYSFVDRPGRGAFYYRLEDIDLSGVTTLHTPVMAQLGPMVRTPWFKPTLPEF